MRFNNNNILILPGFVTRIIQYVKRPIASKKVYWILYQFGLFFNKIIPQHLCACLIVAKNSFSWSRSLRCWLFFSHNVSLPAQTDENQTVQGLDYLYTR